MPIYTYACEKCEDIKEISKGMSDSDPKECPDCGKTIKRVFNVGGIQFKGKGFYSTGG
jgi:putative FmdB family regulatory protein